MGYMQHDAIVVTGWKDEHLEHAHAKAAELGCHVSNIVDPKMNDERSFFFIAPDGSKEGWAHSNAGDKRRAEFVAWMRSSGNYCDWVAVSFGGDSRTASIVDHGDNFPEEEE